MKSLDVLKPLMLPIKALQRLIEDFDNQGVIQFADLLETPEILIDLENIMEKAASGD